MTINPAGIAAYANAARALSGTQSGGAAVGAVQGNTGASFADMLQQAAEGAVSSQKQGEAASLAAVTGKADINSVVQAINNAEMTLQTVVAVRDKVVSAYTEILHMTI